MTAYCKTLFFRRILILRFPHVENLLHFNLADFPVNFIKQLFPVSFCVSTNFYIEISVVLLLTLHIYQDYCISYHGSVDIPRSKVMVMVSSKISRVFNFANLLKSRKFDAREIYILH